MKKQKILKEFQEGRGYTRADWDAVDFPELTDEQITRSYSLEELFPDLHASIQKAKKTSILAHNQQEISVSP